MKTQTLPRFNTFSDLLIDGFGCCDNIFFSNKADWSKIIFMFNGAVTKQKMSINEDAAIFQRWSWHESFKHPVFCIADPLTFGVDSIPLAWYQGISNEVYLELIINKIKSKLKIDKTATKFVAFGSSGGGYAALLSAQLGLVDVAIAVNPQTDILKFEVKTALQQFLNKRTQLGLQFNDENYSLMRIGFSKVKQNCSITYIQNTCDHNHYTEHMLPYVNSSLVNRSVHALNLHCFTGSIAGHNPPALSFLSNISADFESLLK